MPPGQRPPPLKLGSHWQLWSWLIPVFTVSDEELLQLTGLDGLVGAGGTGYGRLGRLVGAVQLEVVRSRGAWTDVCL